MKGRRFAFLKGDETLLGPTPKFARHGQSGGRVSDLLPHHRKIVDEVAEQINSVQDNEVTEDRESVVAMMEQIAGANEQLQDRIDKAENALKDQAKEIADKNVDFFKDAVNSECPLVGIEPSAILTFRDEYLRLAKNKDAAKSIASNAYTMEEFIEREISKGLIKESQFTTKAKKIKVHGHCQQKSLSNMKATFTMLSLPKNFEVSIMNTGCCGMAGSFGFEKEHYDLSMQVGEDTLFPKIRNYKQDVEIIASGTSCRHQILDGTKRLSKHPVSLLKEALK